jgi:hypothetical protein
MEGIKMNAPNGKPQPKIRIVGEDGNAFIILGAATKAMRRAGWSAEEIEEYRNKAMNGDYGNLLNVTGDYCEIS